MHSCSSQLSNKNVFSNFRNESMLKDGSFILAGRSFQIVGPETLNDLGPKLQMSLSWFLECSAALRWQIATVSGRVSQKLRCSRLPDKKVPVHSNTGTLLWGLQLNPHERSKTFNQFMVIMISKTYSHKGQWVLLRTLQAFAHS